MTTRGDRLLQISTADMADLENLIPLVCEVACQSKGATSGVRVASRRIKKILSDVRWSYGPHEDVERIDASDETF